MRRLASVLLLLGLVGGTASGAVISLLGDKDCFGLGGACPDGTLWRDELGGVFFNNYQGPDDPLYTDKWSADANVGYLHEYALDAGPISATLEIRFAGVADNRGPWDVLFNGVLIGQIPVNVAPNAFQEVKTYTWDVPIALLTLSDTVNLQINMPATTDGYSIDYSQLTIETEVVIPEPATVGLLAVGLASLVVARRKRA